MTNTLTTDEVATTNQILALKMRVLTLLEFLVQTKNPLNLKKNNKNVNVPIIADIHFHYKRL